MFIEEAANTNFVVFGLTQPGLEQYNTKFIGPPVTFSGGGSRRKPPTLGKQLVNFFTCGCESSAPFFVIYKAGCEH
jgi:hypothetical protein